MRILGIETSCDETAAAVVEDGRVMLSSVVSSSVDLHAVYGGVVPEIAARSHIESILPVIEQTLQDAFSRQKTVDSSRTSPSTVSGLRSTTGFDPWDQIDAIAVTQGPGLMGSLLVGVLTARTLAIAKNKPLFPVNHVLAHTYANFITEKANSSQLIAYSLNDKQPEFPILALVVSGGHSQLMLYKSHNNYAILGQTRDDAVGEAFDKVAKILGLPYPGGPSIDKAAQNGDPTSVKLPKSKLDNPYDFSFSGLKTATLRAAQQLAGKDYTFPSYELPKVLSDSQKADLAASFQQTAAETLAEATVLAEAEFKPKTVLLAGGVAANQTLRQELQNRLKTPLLCPDIKLCTDNAAMIAAAAFFGPKLPFDPYKLEVIPNLN
jgi:N6-L-threonylcarbamoyladenine synthase